MVHFPLLITFALILSFSEVQLSRPKAHVKETPDYGFVAYLFSTRDPKTRCTGAIIATSWILNYCQHKKFRYDRVRVGPKEILNKINTDMYLYEIDKRIKHPDHTIVKFPEINEHFNLSALYASEGAIFLDHTSREMEWIQGIIRPITVSRNTKLPKQAKTIFFPKAYAHELDAQYKLLPILDNHKCNDYYKRYQLTLFKNQYCVDSSIVTYDECCESHAIMEKHNKLIGAVAWSTACWNPPELWVFSNMGYYYEWIVNITSKDPLFP